MAGKIILALLLFAAPAFAGEMTVTIRPPLKTVNGKALIGRLAITNFYIVYERGAVTVLKDIGTATSFKFIGLIDGDYKVFAYCRNSAGESEWSPEALFNVLTPVDPRDVPGHPMIQVTEIQIIDGDLYVDGWPVEEFV